MAETSSGSLDLIPSPSRLIRKKTGNPSLQDYQPTNPSFSPTDLTACKCTGLLQGNGAVVTVPEHVWGLIKLGFYGKGSFSRTVPCHHRLPSRNDLRQISRKRKTSGLPTGNVLNQWEKRMKLHLQWKDKEGGDTECENRSEHLGILDNTEVAMEDEDYDGFLERLKEVKRRDPYMIDEYLQLGPEETFYLVNELKVLDISSTENSLLQPQQLWSYFIERLPSFAIKYGAYKHFRTGNWVPKSGIKFGVDFLLYKVSPLYYHSSFAVTVQEANGSQKMSWKEVVTITRACQATGKDFLICDVTSPMNMSIKDPNCVDQLTIVDQVIKWWVPEQDREM